MSTRAVYSFRDEQSTYHVYKHHDGYPTGAAEFIHYTLKNAWPLPRFEADEFAASFIAANKPACGGVRMTAGPEKHGDLAYHYVVYMEEGRLTVEAYSGGGGRLLWRGPESEFARWAQGNHE